jgi:uncharacterized protein involved in response to NO
MDSSKSTDMPLLALGFRPFYLLAAMFAVVAVPLWVLSFLGEAQTGNYLRGLNWHSHEMIFGFAPAVIAGFLLTAVRNWTGQPTPTGMPLAALVLLWLLARVLMQTGPANAAAVIDTLFLPALGIAVAIPILRSRNQRNYKVLVILAVLTLANIAYHLASLGFVPSGFSRVSMTAALDVIAILIAIVGGRVVPAFIGNAVKDANPRQIISIEIIAVGALVVILAMGILSPWVPVADNVWFLLLSIAAVGQFIRLMLWQPLRALGNPLLLMLPASYAWLPISLALRALEQQSIVPPGVAIHAFTVGAITSMMIAMMTRSALGHSGRPLVAGPAEIAVFVLLQLSAIVRVLAAPIMPGAYREAMVLAGVLWTLAFAVFLIRYWPILTRPRIDGKPG